MSEAEAIDKDLRQFLKKIIPSLSKKDGFR